MAKNQVKAVRRRRTQLGQAEQAFLLSCVSVDENPPEVAGPLEWEPLLVRLTSDGIAPLAYQRYKPTPECLPAGAFSALKQSYYQNASANHIRLEELKRIGRLLAAEQIPLLILKGGALALSVYSDPALRFMGDLDVAVPPSAAPTALSLLQSEGYTQHDAQGDLADPSLLRGTDWILRLTRQVHGKNMELEFHWPLREKVLIKQIAKMDLQLIWQRSIPLDAANNLWQPAPADMLFHLCMHTGLQHHFSDFGLRHYVDLDRFVRLHGQDSDFWDLFEVQVRNANTVDASYFSLYWSKQLLDTPIPEATMARLRPAAWKRKLMNVMMDRAHILNRLDAFSGRRQVWWRLLTSDHLPSLLMEPFRSLFPGRDYLASFYNVDNDWLLITLAFRHAFHALNRAVTRRFRRWRRRIHLP